MHAPSAHALKRFATGQSSSEEAASVAEWLAGHPDAADTVEAYARDDTLVQNLKNAATFDTSVSSDVQAVINQLLHVSISRDLSSATAKDLVAPKRLNEFRILRIIGQGGMGLVCEALDERLNRKVAIKLMRDSLMIDTANKRRFLREAQAAAAIEHESIVPILSAGEADGMSYLVMPLLQGETLADRLKSGPLAPTDLLRLAVEISEALVAAHDAGIIHRDLKPSNVWLSKRNNEPHVRARLLDFGLARPFDADDRLTQTNQVIGTPAYMAPEQAQGKPVDALTDIFSLGCVLYEAAVGKRAFNGKNVLEILSQIANSAPLPIVKLNHQVAPEFSDLVQTMLAKAPEERPQSMQQVVETTKRIYAQHLNTPQSVQSHVLPQASNRFRGWSHRHKLVALGAMGFGLAATVLGLIIKIRQPDGTETIIKSDGNDTVTVQPSGKIEVTRSEPQTGHMPAATDVTRDRAPSSSPSHSGSENSGRSERTSFEKLLEIGARIGIRYPDGSEYDATRMEEFVEGASIILIHTEHNPQFTDDFFASYVAPLTQLQRLVIPNLPNLSDAARFFEAVGQLKRLTQLVATMPVDDTACEHLSQCAELTYLISVAPQFTESGAKHLRKLERLVEIRFIDGDASDEALAPLLELPKLNAVSIIRANLTGRFLAGDGTPASIQSLDLSLSRFSEDPLQWLSRFPDLQVLTLQRFEDSGRGFAHLSNLRNLHRVDLQESLVRDLEGLQALGRLPGLESLSLHAARFFGDDELKAFVSGNPVRLTGIDLSGTQLTDASVDSLLTLPRLQSLILWGTEVGDAGFAKLASSKTITELVIGSKFLTKETVRALAAREKPWHSIWIGNSSLDDDSIEEFAKFKDLISLRLTGNQITPLGFERLRTLLPRTEITQ